VGVFDPITYFITLVITAMIVNMGLALYGIFFRPSLIKKIIALTILGDTANTFAILLGYRRWMSIDKPSTPPVLMNTTVTQSNIVEFANRAVDSLPQALVLTAVVIGLAVTLFLIFLCLQLYRAYGTLDVREIRKLKG